MMRLLTTMWILLISCLHEHVARSGEVSVNGPIIGIDLGTSFSCVGVIHNGNLEIIANDQGNRVTPSYVALSEDEILVGEVAKNQAALNPKNTAFQVKRIIGRRWSEPELQEDMNKFPFRVVDRSGRPYVLLASSQKVKLMSPEEISGIILNKMKQTAEVFVGKKIHQAVVTVPAYFTDAQRRATKDAAKIGGLEVMRIVNEPTAAAIAHGAGKRYAGEKTLLVFDLGGGTFDVSVVKITNGNFRVLATNGDTHLGGEDFDNRVLQHFMNVFNRKYWKQGEVLNFQSQDPKVARAIQRLRKEVEKGKKALSSKITRVIRIEIDSFYAGIDFSEKLTRATFEELNIDLFKKVNVPLENVLKDATLTKHDIDEVLLVGGSTKIPKIQQLVKDFFEGKEPVQNINPDEAVALGAAILAGELAGEQIDMLQDVIPMSLGKATCHNFDPSDCDHMSVIIPRNTLTSRADVSKIYTTTEDEQDNVLIEVYEGEHKKASTNNFLGSFILTGLKIAPKGVPQIRVNFKVDTDGILHVTAQELGTNNKKEITIIGDQNKLTYEERLVATKQVQQLEIENIHDEL